jgi:hypothetical protein
MSSRCDVLVPALTSSLYFLEYHGMRLNTRSTHTREQIVGRESYSKGAVRTPFCSQADKPRSSPGSQHTHTHDTEIRKEQRASRLETERPYVLTLRGMSRPLQYHRRRWMNKTREPSGDCHHSFATTNERVRCCSHGTRKHDTHDTHTRYLAGLLGAWTTSGHCRFDIETQQHLRLSQREASERKLDHFDARA